MLSRFAAVLTVALFVSSAALAQGVGAEFEFNEVLANGSFNMCACGTVFNGRSADWNLSGNLLFELPVSRESFLTFRFGNRRLSAQYAMNAADTIGVIDGYDVDTFVHTRVKDVGSWHVNYLNFSAAFGTRVFSDLEAYLGVGVQLISGAGQHFERQLIEAPEGTRFLSTGTTTEVVVERDLTSNEVSSVHPTGMLGIQYRWKELAPIVLVPKIQAEIEMTPVFKSPNKGVNTVNVLAGISALYSF